MRPLRDEDFDEDGKLRKMPKVLADGETMRFSMAMSMKDSAGRSRVTDGNGNDGIALCRPGFRVVNDASARDAKAEAYRQYDADLRRAYLDADNTSSPTGAGSHGPIGAREGEECTLDGAPGHLHRIGGRLICVADPRSTSARPVQRNDAHDAKDWARIREEMYSRYDLEASLAWQNLPWRNVR